MRAPSARTRRIVTLTSAPLAVLLAGVVVWTGSNSAFSSDTRNIGNNWETGSVALSNDANGVAMFSVQHVVPAQTGQKCIRVTATSSVPGVVKLYVANLALDGLQDYVKVTIVQGTGGGSADCTSFIPGTTEASQSLTSLFTNHTSFETAILPWAIAGNVVGGESQTYKVSWVFDVGSMDQIGIDALQGKATSINLEWELQNTLAP